MHEDGVTAAARLIYAAERIVVFTGAGISTESGVPDFRSPGGIWSQYNADDLTYQKFRADEKDPETLLGLRSRQISRDEGCSPEFCAQGRGRY